MIHEPDKAHIENELKAAGADKVIFQTLDRGTKHGVGIEKGEHKHAVIYYDDDAAISALTEWMNEL